MMEIQDILNLENEIIDSDTFWDISWVGGVKTITHHGKSEIEGFDLYEVVLKDGYSLNLYADKEEVINIFED